ncbi:zinc ABC transporter substrate-binding protein [Nonomuraea aridisoli]|uniref:Zinc ABC transporter substrate-binding protein n=2 Tax=Nonomuraea aridisoli TaxID=2070368 RepID=A0A2W2FH65_9ACTN|nr:zinc ABC transporter substrate-binding protein [Nonomuraea aridisoli]
MILALLTSAACGGGGEPAEGAADTLSVVATTTQVADFARQIGGGAVHVTQLLRPNVDPHDFDPSPADLQALADADVIVENGVGFEPWLDEAVSSAGHAGEVVDASRGAHLREGHHEEEAAEHPDGEHEHGEHDPHIWHDPANAKVMAANIEQALAKADPSGAAGYAQRRRAYDAELDRLDDWIEQRISTIPRSDRKVVTNHDAFGYYLDRYGLTYVGAIIPSFDTSAEITGKNLTDLVAGVKNAGVKAIFSESTLPPKAAQALAAEAGVQVVGGENALYGDSLGPAGGDADTYITMMRHNTEVIVDALG